MRGTTPLLLNLIKQHQGALSSVRNLHEDKKTEESTESSVVKRPYYSPFKTDNAVDFAIARIDDLVNWGRKVTEISEKYDFEIHI